jgi:HD-GYP domain-containing protein (c-di-GMP phosphodiesterase class II)
VAGELLCRGRDQLAWEAERWIDLQRAVLERGQAEFLAESSPFLVLAVPVVPQTPSPFSSHGWVALGVFATRLDMTPQERADAAELLGIGPDVLAAWLARQTPIAAATLERLVELMLAEQASQRRAQQLEADVSKLSHQLCNTYEEISLIYQLTDNLTLSRHEDDLAVKALEWLGELLPAEGLAIQRVSYYGGESRRRLLVEGDCPLNNDEFSALIEFLGLNASRRAVVVNRSVTRQSCWPQPAVREVIALPLYEGETFFGWLAAFNHKRGGQFGSGSEFGSVEASLLGSVSAMLGVHRGNTELYRGQAQLMCNMVQALTSAIDAKDPYTCGHSTRVARVAHRLASQLGCDQRTTSTIYLAGVLHDVGKIGIDDNVLRKPGKLTPEEYEHIKLHPQLGYNILCGIKQLEPVLPVVLHHHEAWNGTGYPHGLAGEAIPYLARITAVADAFDAMGSDRCYRKGMDDERLDAILREGAGGQWDAAVISAFFAARDEIRQIARGERDVDVPELASLFLR